MKTIDFLVQELPTLGGWPEGTIGAGFLCGEGMLYFWDENGDCPSKWRINTEAEVEDSASEVSREQYEAALAAKNDGWIDWAGGECPLVDDALVEVRYRNEKSYHIKGINAAGKWNWRHDGHEGDIIAYRLHQPQESEQSEASEEDLNDCVGYAPSTVWNGEGLPPVGCECEYSWAGEPWAIGVIRYISKHTIIIETQADPTGDTECAYSPTDIKFRPLRTEAERAIDEMVRLSGVSIGAAKILYDMGYRKG